MGSLVTSLGPEPDPPVWRIYDGFQRADGKVDCISLHLFMNVTQEVSIHIYEKRGSDKVGRCRKKEAIAEMLKTGIKKLEFHSSPWLLKVLHGVCRKNISVFKEINLFESQGRRKQ